MKRYLLLYASIFILASCSFKEMNLSEQNNKGFTIEEAKAFFEKDYSNGLTKGKINNRYGILNPGDFTPMWDTALYSNNGEYAAYDIDIYSTRHISVIQAEFIQNKSKAQRLPVYQKLVIIKNLKTGKLYNYVLSLIPNIKNYNYRGLKNYTSLKPNKKNYCGLAIYASTVNGALNRIHKFKDGKKVDAVLMNEGIATLGKRCNKIIGFFHGIELISSNVTTTKSGEDWWYEDDYIDDSDYENELDQYDNFADWFLTEIWPNANDGDHFTMNYDEMNNTWYLEDQSGNTFIVPDEVCTGDGVYDDWGDDNDFENGNNYDEDNLSNDNGSLDNIILQVYCPNCGKHLGTANFDNLDDKLFYCDECKVYFKIP